MGGVHTETPATSGGPAPVKCQQCGKALEKSPFMVTVNFLNTNTGSERTIEAPVCDEECAQMYMFRVRETLMMTNLKGYEAS